jgi:uncharacterized protein
MVTERFEMRLEESLIERIDRWRKHQSDYPNRTEAVRRLVEESLDKHSTRSVNFTDGEKLIMAMLSDLHLHMKIKGEIDTKFVMDALVGGHYWAPKLTMTGLFHEHSDKESDLDFVFDVLDLWSFIEQGFARLSKADKKRVADQVEIFGEDPKFHGFDGNNESDLMSIAQFLIQKMGRFQTFAKRDLNSHCEKAYAYRSMVRAFTPIRVKLDGRGLTADEIIKIMNVPYATR